MSTYSLSLEIYWSKKKKKVRSTWLIVCVFPVNILEIPAIIRQKELLLSQINEYATANLLHCPDWIQLFVARIFNRFLNISKVIFISRPALSHFKSLSVPLLNIKDGKLQQPWFGANYYQAIVIPVSTFNTC